MLPQAKNALLEPTTSAALSRAIEENGAAFLLALGRVGGGVERDEPAIQWVIGGSPIDYHNCVVRADLAPEDADALIAASIAQFQQQGVPGTWHVGPAMRPADLGARLVAQGFTYAGDEFGMAVELRALPEQIDAPATLTIERVRNEQDLAVWMRTLAMGFGEGEREAAWVGAMYRRIGFGDQLPWRHYIGHLADTPVATASLFLAAGVAGIYFVFTIPSARRQGIGAAITQTALRDAQSLGYTVGVLGASQAGYAVYRRLGFQEYCRIGMYEWGLEMRD